MTKKSYVFINRCLKLIVIRGELTLWPSMSPDTFSMLCLIIFNIFQMFLNNVLEDSFAKFGKQMQIEFHHDIRGQGMVILILHFLMVLKTLKPNEIMQPLMLMATNPIGLEVMISA